MLQEAMDETSKIIPGGCILKLGRPMSLKYKGHYDTITELLLQAPTRTCIACGRRRIKSEMLRFVSRGARVIADTTAKLPGRGAYICQAEGCLAKGFSARAFSRSFRRKIDSASVLAAKEAINL